MGLAAIFIASMLMGFSGAIVPGPLFTVTINESLRRGAKAGLKLQKKLFTPLVYRFVLGVCGFI